MKKFEEFFNYDDSINLRIKTIVIISIIILFGGAWLDAIIFKKNTFMGYLIICTWESFIFFCGFTLGELIKIKKNNNLKDEKTEGEKK